MNLEDSIGYLIRRTGQGLRNLIQERLKEAGLEITMEQGGVLMRLAHGEGCTQHALSELLCRDKTTVARVLNNMEEKSLIVRVPSEKDARKKLLYLTQTGKDLQVQLQQLIQQTLGEMVEGVEPDELVVFKKVINQIYGNITSVNPGDINVCK